MGKKSSGRLRQILKVLKDNEIVRGGMSPEKMRRILEELGPTFIKFGQILSMRPDLIPQAYCDEFENLRTDVDPMPFSQVKELITRECQREHAEVFASIDEEPLGSASIAQVHRAVLLDGREVVIKIQRPHIHDIMEKDIKLFKKALTTLKVVNPMGDAIDFQMVLDEMWESAQLEFDFLQEAMNLKRFADFNRDIRYVSCPDVVFEYTTSRMLIMEYVEGIQIDDIDALEALGYDMKEIGDKLAENYVKQILEDAFFQADPHPGNLVIRDGQIVWIDLGMIGHLTKQDKQLFSSALEAVVYGDIYEIKDAVLSVCTVHGKIDHNALYNDLDRIISKYVKMDFQTLNVGEVIMDVQEVLNQHHISIGSGLTMLIRGVVTIEGVLRDISPETDFMTVFSNHVRQRSVTKDKITEELKRAGVESMHVAKRMIRLPGNLLDLIRMFTKGQTKVNIEISESGEFFSHLDEMINRLAIAIIDAALLISSSMICMTDMKGRLFGIPALGTVGFFVAIILGVWLIWSILKNRKLH